MRKALKKNKCNTNVFVANYLGLKITSLCKQSLQRDLSVLFLNNSKKSPTNIVKSPKCMFSQNLANVQSSFLSKNILH